MVSRYVIWGAGFRGKSVLDFLGEERVVAFIDKKEEMWGQKYYGIDVMNFEEYLQNYQEYFIIISPLKNGEIIDFLNKSGVYRYFLLSDCPSELMGFGTPDLLTNLPLKYDCNEINAIYGLTLFSILLYEELVFRGCKELQLIPQRGLDKKILYEIAHTYKEYNITLEAVFENINKIYVTVDYDMCFLLKKIKEEKIIDAFDFSNRIKEYYNTRIGELKDIHKGKRCFIVATGPSLKMEDLDYLKNNNEICISMNKVFCAFPSTAWRPDYYVVFDKIAVATYGEEIKRMDVKHIFVSDAYQEFWSENISDNIYKYHATYWGIDHNLGKPRFSADVAQNMYGGSTVTYLCIQLAMYLGFNEIYLLGVDFNYHSDMGDKRNHFISGYADKQLDSGSCFQRDESLAAFETAREYAESQGVKIYNATCGGKLEVFERRDFETLFSCRD